MMTNTELLKIQLFVDTGSIEVIRDAQQNKRIRGITTNPSLIRKSGAITYRQFCQDALCYAGHLPISIGLPSEQRKDIIHDAKFLQKLVIDNKTKLYVKVPIINSCGKYNEAIIKDLCDMGLSINVTAVFTKNHIDAAIRFLRNDESHIISIFSGRIADTGRDPIEYIHYAKGQLINMPDIKVLWASTREVLNIFQANDAGCDIITVAPELLRKINLYGKDLDDFCLETVKAFQKDVTTMNYQLTS